MKIPHILNQAFEKAFMHTRSQDSLDQILDFLKTELPCGAVSVFDELPEDLPAFFSRRAESSGYCLTEDLSSLQAEAPGAFAFFSWRRTHSLVLASLTFHNRTLGFLALENPAPEVLENVDELLPGLRYILSSYVYINHLVHTLDRIGYSDSLTGIGNRHGLQDYLEKIPSSASIGILYCDVLGWEIDDGSPSHMEEDQMILHTSRTLCNVFGEGSVFRIASTEFLVASTPVEEEAFLNLKQLVRGLFRQQDLMVAIGDRWAAQAGEGTHDALIRQAHLFMSNDKHALEKELEKKHSGQEASHRRSRFQSANIPLLHGNDFFRGADAWLSEIFDECVISAVLDINYFRMYNDIFGRKAGNLFLETLAESLALLAEEHGGIAGYLGGDNFCLMLPSPSRDVEKVKPVICDLLSSLKYTDGFAPICGIYFSEDRMETSSTLYDRSLSALSEIKGSYTRHINFYNAQHFQSARDHKLLLMDVKAAIPSGEFIFYLQPQVHDRTGKIIGAEALVRWKRPDGLRMPSSFIDALEKSGYIFAVDCHVWESVCRWLRSRLDQGLPVVPCSVNVSRIDFYFTDIGDHFISLLEKYDLPATLLGIEITESAFTDNMDSIMKAVQKLHNAGFLVLMDDFGSGSSSLSMLHTMNLDVLKTDVKFMSQKDSDSKAISIVESVISMAHMIGMLVITEGVETKEQRDNLIVLGDNYTQGFYFYEPMPVEEFELLLNDPENLGEPPRKGGPIMTNHLHLRTMIQEGIVSETLLDSIIGPAAVYKETQGSFVILQMNEPYSKLTGIKPGDSEQMEHFIELFHHENSARVIEIFHGADYHPLDGAFGSVLFHRKDGTDITMYARVFLLYSCDDHKLYLTTIQT